jgi:ABC-type transport system involved in multi-copper enzyme maturation permease subunit
MRRFLILMWREIRDQVAFFLSAAIFSGLFILPLVGLVLGDHPEVTMLLSVTILLPAALLFTLFLCGFGASQMVSDRTKNLSAFLTVLPVTRGQVFLARLAVGVLWVLTFVLPLTITGAILINLRTPPGIPLYRGLLPDLFAGVFLTCFACYCCGLYAGWRTGTAIRSWAILPFAALLPLLIIIKGFGAELIVILLFFIAACIAATWHRYSRSSL